MELTALEIVYIAGGFTIIGALIGALATYCLSFKLVERTHRNTINLIQRQEFNKAAANFRTVFTNELRYFQNLITYNEAVSEETILKLLEAADTKFNNACIRFKHHLPDAQRIGFDNAWREYCHPQGCDPKQVPGPYIEYFIDLSFHESISLIIKKMEKLLKFAKQK